MTFRFPYQILRAVSRPSSPNKLITPNTLRNGIQRNISSIVSNNYNREVPQYSKVYYARQKPSPLPQYLRQYSRSTNLENRKKVRRQHKCNERKCEKLAFRQTTREECEKCMDCITVPDKCPRLRRLKPEYDDSKLKYKHKYCKVDCCPERMDVIKGLKVVKKKLPKLGDNDCEKCSQPIRVPPKAPKLVRPNRMYDASKLKQIRKCVEPCTDLPPRMDNVRGYKVKPKTLPKLKPSKDCVKCIWHVPTKAPKLVRPSKRYDPYKMEQKRECEEFVCPPRMDDVVGFKVKEKELPKLPLNDCGECVNHVPKYAPKLTRPKMKYDPSEMKWDHKFCKTFCDDKPPRMDDVMGFTVERKSLPILKASDCDLCIQQVPKTAPKLNRPEKKYDDTELKWNHICIVDDCTAHPERSDVINGYTIEPKKLPKLELSTECTYCRDAVPTTAPKLVRPEKIYDDFEMKFNHSNCKGKCDLPPPRSDVVRGYKVEQKELKPIPLNKDCIQCTQFKPTEAPKLTRPEALYDPSKLEQVRLCDKDTCNIDPPRMDDVVGYKVKSKELPELPLNDCGECVNHVPKYSPKLVRPKQKYDPSKMKYNHPNCKELCVDLPPRMDAIRGYEVTPKELPKIAAPNDCPECVNFVPKYAPELKRPKLRYDPATLEKPRPEKVDLCDLDPPRMDDVLCWKPKKKKLPAFISSQQTRGYSTFTTPVNPTYAVYSVKNYSGLRQKAHTYSRRYSKKSRKPKKPKDCPPVCKKLKKLPECAPCAHTHCVYYVEQPPCKKIESPYSAYSDCMDGFFEDELSECINYNQVLLQPQKQVSGTFYKLKPPPPKWGHIDPSLERKCIEKGLGKKIPHVHGEDKWKTPCALHKEGDCAPRGRKHCNIFVHDPPCKKLEAPYKSFSDRCPQFPELILTECDLADQYVLEQKSLKMPIFERPKKCDPQCCPPSKSSKTGRSKCKSSKSGGVKCKPSKKEVNVEIGGAKYKCKSADIPAGKDQEIKAIICTPKSSGEKMICICKPIPKSGCPKSNETKKSFSKSSVKCGGKEKSIKVILCSPKKSSKPVSKSEDRSKPPVSEPKKVSSKTKCPPSKCKESSNSHSCCGFKLSDMKKQTAVSSSCDDKLPPPDKVPPPSLWKRICTFFKARPGCPGPNEWKQKELEAKARKAAAAAGLEICEPKCKYVKINKKKCAGKTMGKSARSCCPKPKLPPCPNLKRTVSIPKKLYCPKPKKASVCPKPKSTSCLKLKKKPKKCKRGKPKLTPCCPKPSKKKKPQRCPSKKKVKCSNKSPILAKGKTQSDKVGKDSEKTNLPTRHKRSYSKIPGPACVPKKNYATYVARSRFSTYSRFLAVNKQAKKKNKRILTCPNKVDTDANQSSTISNYSHSYLSLNNNYVGKIYKLKLQKIGLRNGLITRNIEEEPYTICHTCKVIPRHESVCKNANPDIKNLKIKSNSENIKILN